MIDTPPGRNGRLALTLLMVLCGLCGAPGCEKPPAGKPVSATVPSFAGTLSGNTTVLGPAVLADDTLLAAGATLLLGPGSGLQVAKGKTLTVQGTLIVQGSSDNLVLFAAQQDDQPGAWGGINLVQGGAVQLSYVAIRDADVALTAAAGSTYTLAHVTVDSCNQIAQLFASGTISAGQFHALGSQQQAAPLSLYQCSPTFTDVLFDQGDPGQDAIVVDGDSSAPIFDHVEVSGSHSALLLLAGSGVLIDGASFHDNGYGVIAGAALGTVVRDSDFINDMAPIGLCAGGTVTARGDYFDTPPFDASCSGQVNANPAPAPLPGAGPR